MAIAAAATSSAASTAATTAQEKALLARLLRSYQTALNGGQTAATLRGQAQQISATAKLLGQNVSLPTASAAATPAASSTPVTGVGGLNLRS